jgi:hypothetical protein
VTWQVTVEFADEEEARAFFRMACAAQQDLVPLVWRGLGVNLKYAELRTVTGVSIQKEPGSDH